MVGIKETAVQGFQRNRRLRQKSDFSRVFSRNVRSSDEMFTVLGRPGADKESRLGMAISIKATGGAVGRNRIKRLVRESFRGIRANLPLVDVVVMAKQGITTHDNKRIRDSLAKHWSRIGKQCDRSSQA